MQFTQVERGSSAPKKRHCGSTGVWLELALYVKDVAPSLCASPQHVSIDAQWVEKPTM